MLFHASIDSTGELVRDYTVAIVGGIISITGMIMWSLEGPGGYHLFPKENEE